MNAFALRLLFTLFRHLRPSARSAVKLCLLSSVLSLLFTFPPAHAQTTPASAEPPKPARLRFLFLDETPGAYAIKTGATAFRQISGNPYEISSPYSPALPVAPLDIYKTFPADLDPATGQPKRVKIATVTPPAGTPSALVIITPRPAATPDVAPVYQVELIDSNPTDFPPGSIRIINRSPVAMAAEFSNSRVLTAPGEIKLVRPTTDSRRRVLFKIAIQVQQENGGWQLIQDSITVIRPAERMVGILVYSPGGMRHMLTASEIAEMGPPKPGCFWLAYSDTP